MKSVTSYLFHRKKLPESRFSAQLTELVSGPFLIQEHVEEFIKRINNSILPNTCPECIQEIDLILNSPKHSTTTKANAIVLFDLLTYGSEKFRSSMDEFLMRTLKRIIKYHEDTELELLLKPLVKKWAKEFINEKYKEGVKYYIELGDKLFTRGLIEMNSADSAQSNFAHRIVSMESLNNVNGYASVIIRPNKEIDRVKEEEETTSNRRDSIDVVMTKKEESKPSVVGLDLETLNDKCVKVLKEAKEVNQTGKGVEKCLKKLIKLKSLIEATLDSQKDIDISKREWFQGVETKMSKVIERFNELSNESKESDESENGESDTDNEIEHISVVKKNSKKHIKQVEEEEEEYEKEVEDEKPRKKSISNRHLHSKEENEENSENKHRKHSSRHLKEDKQQNEKDVEEGLRKKSLSNKHLHSKESNEEVNENKGRKHSNLHLNQGQQQQLETKVEKEKEKNHKHHHKEQKKEEKEKEEDNDDEEKESKLPPPPSTLHIVTSPPPDQTNQKRQRTASLPSPSYDSSKPSTNVFNYNNNQRNMDLTKSISDVSISSHNLNLSSRQLSKSTSHLGSKTSGKPPLSPASLKRKEMQQLISPVGGRNTSIPQQRQFSPTNPFLNPEIVNNTRHQRSNSDQIFNSISGITNPFLKPPPPPAPKIPNFNNPLKVYLDTPSGKLEPIEERDSNWDLGNNDLDIKDILQKKENDTANPFLGSTTPKKENLSSRHITGKNPFESPTIVEEEVEQPQQKPVTAPSQVTNPFIKLQKESSDSSVPKNPFQGISDANPFSNTRTRSNSMPVDSSSTNLFTNPYFMSQTTTFNNSSPSNIFTQKQQPATESRKRFSTNPFDMVDDEDVIRAANEDFTPVADELDKEKELPDHQETVEEKPEDEVVEKPESNSDLFASMFAFNPEPPPQQQSSEEGEEKKESNSDLFASMFDSIESKPDAIEEQTKVDDVESPKKPTVSDQFISSMLNTIPDKVELNNKNSEENKN